MANNKEIPEKERLESNELSNLSYIKISDKLLDAQVIDNITYNFWKKWLLKLGIDKLNKWNLESTIEKSIFDNSINKKEIEAIWYIDWFISIHLKNWKIKVFDLKKHLDKVLLDSILVDTTKEKVENKVKNLNSAIEKIFYDNNFWINWEIKDNDKLISSRFWKDLKYKTLWELKDLLDIENKKLFKVYDITWETSKKQELLKQEIKIYTWIWDDYEWWAWYFELSLPEISSKVEELCSSMSMKEVFEYIRRINKDIDWNFRRWDMVQQVNQKLVNALYSYSFERLKKENSDNKKFIELIKVMTWRWKLKIENWEKYEEMQDFDYENDILWFNMSLDFANTVLANHVLIHLMYKEWGLLSKGDKEKNNSKDGKIRKKQKIKIEDENLNWKTPQEVISEAKNIFNNSVDNKVPDYWVIMLGLLWYDKFLNISKSYDELSFNEKIEIWSLARIVIEIKNWNISKDKINNQNYLTELSKNITWDTFETLNESLSDNFDSNLSNINWKDAKDFNLKWTEAEIFELYQDINWAWVFDIKDSNIPWIDKIAMWITLVSALFILWPIFVAWASKYTFYSGFVAWSKLWLVSWVSGQVFSRQWYESYTEWFLDITSQIWIEVIISALFTATWLKVLQKLWVLNPDLFASISAWISKWWITDKLFIWWEVVSTMVLSQYMSDIIKKEYIENHTNTDNKNNTWQIIKNS